MRSLGFGGPMVVIPAGFDVEGAESFGNSVDGTQPWPEIKPKSYFLYLARIHPNKGIELLLEAWRRLAPGFPETKLVIVGAGEADYVQRFRGILNSPGLSGRCEWKGFVCEVEKAWCFRHARFYCLPSYTENFGNTVQESLGFGTPVLTTTETPWSELPAEDCGWLSSCDLESVTVELGRALSVSDDRLAAMGRNGVAYIRREFSLDSVIAKQIATYRWLLGGASPDAILVKDGVR
jgi:glycosyltransferase involved in cell wall biosynthesis